MESKRIERRRKVSRTSARRWELTATLFDRPPVPASLLLSLRRLDPELELYWHGWRRHWVLYRVARHGTTPGGDVLVKQLDIMGPGGQYRPLGNWLLDWLRKNDKTEGGSRDPLWADRQWLRALEQIEERDAAERAKKRDEFSKDFVHEAERWAGRAPFTREVRRNHDARPANASAG